MSRQRPAFGASTIEAQTSGRGPRALKVALALALAAGGGIVAWKGLGLGSTRAHDEVFAAEHPAALDAIDLSAVHHQLWGDWALLQENKYRSRDSEARIADASEAMRAAIAPDQNLTAIFTEIEELVQDGKLRNSAKRARILWLSRAWNQYMDLHARPYFLKAFVVLDPNPEFHVYAYEVVGETHASLDGDPERVRFVSRVDEVNRAEWYHASTPSEGAVVRVDSVTRFALDEVWPLFGAADPKFSRRKAYAAPVLDEATAALPEASIALLRATADVRAAAVRAHSEIRERHCSGFVIGRQPWDGFDGDGLQELHANIGSGRCAGVYPSEFKTLDQARTTFVETEGLEPALQSLVEWLARTRVIHELRHVGLGVDHYDSGTDSTCHICAADLSNAARAEVAALVAEWAWTESPATSLYWQCYDAQDLDGGPTAIALKGLGWSCAEGPHANLNDAARELEVRAFGASIPIEAKGAVSRPLPLDRSVVHLREAMR